MKVKDDYQFKGQITIFDILDQDIWFGKMSQEHSAQELPREQTSEQSLKKSLKLLSRKSPIFLSLKRDGPTQDASKEWVMMDVPSALPGDSTMLNTGECPNVERESHLSQILEATPHPKYSLSARACQGILNRANRRGKQLPEILEKALIRQSASKSEQDVQGGVKEFSSNTTESEHCQPSTTNPSSDDVYCIQGNCIDRSDTAGCNGKGWRTNESFTLNTVDHHAVCQPTNDKETSVICVETEVKVRKYPVDTEHLIECLQKHKNMPISEIAERLNKPKTLVEHWFRKDRCFAIPDADTWLKLKELIGIETNEFDASIMTYVTRSGKYDTANRIHIGEVSPTFTASSENTMFCLEDKEPQVICIGNGQTNQSIGEKAGAINCMHDQQAVVCYGLDRASFNQGKNAKYDFSVEENKAQTIVSRGPGGVMTLSEAYVQETRKE